MHYRGIEVDDKPAVDQRHDATRETLCVRGPRFAEAGGKEPADDGYLGCAALLTCSRLALLCPPCPPLGGCMRMYSFRLKRNTRQIVRVFLFSSAGCLQRAARRHMVLNMFYLRATEDLSPHAWASILDEDFTCIMPITPFRSIPPEEVGPL